MGENDSPRVLTQGDVIQGGGVGENDSPRVLTQGDVTQRGGGE